MERRDGMIDTLPQLAALSKSWLASLRGEDPELYEELAADIVIMLARGPVATGLPAGVDAALSQVDLCDKQIGTFHFTPGCDGEAAERIAAYDRRVREDYDVEGGVVFLGGHGAGYVFVSPQGVALLDIVAQPPRIRPFARDFTGFLIAQTNAYDADRRFLGKAADLAGYQAAAITCSALPAMADVEVMAIFEAQRTG